MRSAERRLEVLIYSEQWNSIVVAVLMVPLTLPLNHVAVTPPGRCPSLTTLMSRSTDTLSGGARCCRDRHRDNAGRRRPCRKQRAASYDRNPDRPRAGARHLAHRMGTTAPCLCGRRLHRRGAPRKKPAGSHEPTGCFLSRILEREKGFEPSTSTLARWHSTAELLPRKGTASTIRGGVCQACGRVFR